MILLLITCLDGSQVNLKVRDDFVFNVTTKFGVLKVPVKDIRDINVGIHIDKPEAYIDAAKSLGKEAYKDRAFATKFLKDNPRGGWKYIQPLQNNPDPEVAQRVKQLIDGFVDRPPVQDNVALSGTYLAGDISNTEIEGVSDSLGPLKISFSQMLRIVVRTGVRDINLNSASEEWVEIGYVYDGRVTITASGTIDLFPGTPGQYTTTPKGYTAAGKGGGYMAGALVGRGSDGKEFLIGDRFSTMNFPRGKLEARIVASPWNNPSSGTYELKIE